MADLSITPGLVIFTSGAKITGVAGATIIAGQALYLDATTGLLKLAQCDGTAAEADCVGIALHAATAGQPLVYVGSGSRLVIGGATSKATTYHVSAAAGGICPQADLVSTNKIVRVGVAVDTSGNFIVDLGNNLVVV